MRRLVVALALLAAAPAGASAATQRIDLELQANEYDRRGEVVLLLAGGWEDERLGGGGLLAESAVTGSGFSSRSTLYDEDGAIRGRTELAARAAGEEVVLDGTFTATGGSGAYRGARGRLAAGGVVTDAGLGVVQLRLRGALEVDPAPRRARPRARRRDVDARIAAAGTGSGADPGVNLVAGRATGFGARPGVWVAAVDGLVQEARVRWRYYDGLGSFGGSAPFVRTLSDDGGFTFGPARSAITPRFTRPVSAGRYAGLRLRVEEPLVGRSDPQTGYVTLRFGGTAVW